MTKLAKYKAAPFYVVNTGESDVKFDWLGEYVTNKADEIAVLNGLVPKWISKVDEPKVDDDNAGIESEESPEIIEETNTTEAAVTDAVEVPDETPKPTAKGRKSSGK